MSSSWFSLSLPNPFNSDDQQSPPHSPNATAVKPDFSVITQSIGRQLHNVASFLAPPPQPSSSSPAPLLPDDSGDTSLFYTNSYRGIKNDLAEIGGSFRTGLSLLSSKKAVSEISKFASNLLPFDEGDESAEVEAVGITDDVIDFVRQISLRPECWIDFPLSLQHKDFNMSSIQKDHATTIEQLVPSLTALRHKINRFLREEKFWMIYFILLLPRLDEDDYMLLSTPEIVQMREVLLEKLRNKRNTPMGLSGGTPKELEDRTASGKGSLVNSTGEIEKPFQAGENPSAKNRVPEDDVSFSDVEDDDSDLSARPSRLRQSQSSTLSSPSETGDWVRLNEMSATHGVESKAGHSTYRERHSESEESSEWLTVEDVDL